MEINVCNALHEEDDQIHYVFYSILFAHCTEETLLDSLRLLFLGSLRTHGEDSARSITSFVFRFISLCTKKTLLDPLRLLFPGSLRSARRRPCQIHYVFCFQVHCALHEEDPVRFITSCFKVDCTLHGEDPARSITSFVPGSLHTPRRRLYLIHYVFCFQVHCALHGEDPARSITSFVSRFIAHCTEKTLDAYLWASREYRTNDQVINFIN